MKKKLLITMAVITLFTTMLVGCTKAVPPSSPSPPSTSPPATVTSETPLIPPPTSASPPSPATTEDNNGSAPATLQSGMTLQVTEPADAATITTDTVTVKGQTKTGATVSINDQVGTADDQGKFSLPINVEAGPYAIDVIATDGSGNQGEVLLMENVDLSQAQDSTIPDINSTAAATESTGNVPLKITAPIDGADISTDTVMVQGQTAPDATVSVNDQVGAADNQGNFSVTVSLVPGSNAIDVTVTNEDGNQNEQILMVNDNASS